MIKIFKLGAPLSAVISVLSSSLFCLCLVAVGFYIATLAVPTH